MNLTPNKAPSGYSRNSKRRSIRDVCLRTIVAESPAARSLSGSSASLMSLEKKRLAPTPVKSTAERRRLLNPSVAALLMKDDSSMSIMSGSTEAESSYGSLESRHYQRSSIASITSCEVSMASLQEQPAQHTATISRPSEFSEYYAVVKTTTPVSTGTAVPATAKSKRVCFSPTLEVREYNLVLGDNPSASYPLALDWAHTATRTTSAEDLPEIITGIQRLQVSSRIDRLVNMGWNKKLLRAMERDRKMLLVKEWSRRDLVDEDDDLEVLPPPRVIRID